MLKILSGNAHPALAENISAYVGEPLTEVEIRRFPDGEIFVKIIENIRGCDLFILQPTCSPPNDNLMELLIMIDAARRASAARITAVLPFFGYARQDRKDQPRVPITAKLVANLLAAAGADRVLTMDLHAQQIQGFFDIPVDHLYAAPVFSEWLAGRSMQRLVVVAPDAGGLKAAHNFAQDVGAGLALVAKQRHSASEVEAMRLVGDVRDCDVLLLDDLTTTAGTLCAAADLLERHGAQAIFAAVSHALLVPEGIRRLKASSIRELVVTDSVPPRDWEGYPVTVLSVAGLLGEAMLRIHNNQSVSSLIKIGTNKPDRE